MIKRKLYGFLVEKGIVGAVEFALLFYLVTFILYGFLFYIFIYKDYIRIKKKSRINNSTPVFFLKTVIFAFMSALIFIILF